MELGKKKSMKDNVKPRWDKTGAGAPVSIDTIMKGSDSIILSVYTSAVNVPSGGSNLFYQLLWITAIR